MKQTDLFPSPPPPRPVPTPPGRYDLPADYGEATDWTPMEVPEGLRLPLLDGDA